MKVLLTGAFGNVGASALDELARQGHTVRCFDLRTPANERAARARQREHGGQIEIAWGDLRRPGDVAAAVHGQDVVAHLAFIIPKLSATGFESENRPEWAREINVGGTRHVIEAMQSQSSPARLLFTSSYHVFGRTQHLPPPRTALDPVDPIEHYSRHKVECEALVRASGLAWTIFRLAAALPLALRPDPGMFDLPLDNRIEFVHTRDVGLAIANGVSNAAVWGRLLLIGGGPRCQYVYRQLVERNLEAMGIGMLPDAAFNTTPYPTDWIDTAESQGLLRYQRSDLDDYVAEMKAKLGLRRHVVRLIRPLARRWLLTKSPYYSRRRPSTST